MKKLRHLLSAIIPILLPLTALVASLVMAVPVSAATTANITITATPSFISISVNNTSYDFGVVTAGTTVNTSTTTTFQVNNLCTVITNVAISVNQSTWTGGTAWTHNNSGTTGTDIVGLKANKGGSWGSGDVIVTTTGANTIHRDGAVKCHPLFRTGCKKQSRW